MKYGLNNIVCRKILNSSDNPPVVEYYNSLGDILKTETYDFNNQVIITDMFYNYRGQIINKSLPYFQGATGIYMNFVYDEYGRTKNVSIPSDDYYTENIYSSKQLVKNVTKSGITQQEITIYDALGRVMEVTDNSGSKVFHSYNNASLLSEAWVVQSGGSAQNIVKVKMKYDLHGNRILLEDPDAGNISSVFDAYNRLISYTDANHKTTTYNYDIAGRVLSKTNSDGTITWEYDTKPTGKGQLSRITTTEGVIFEYTYDNLGRLASSSENIDNRTFVSNISYDNYSRVNKLTYPDGFAVTYSYQNGFLKEVRNFANNGLVWQGVSQNVFGDYNVYKSGTNNDITTNITKDFMGRTTEIKTLSAATPIQWWQYDYTEMNNINSRTDNITGQSETFEYDNLNRLSNTYLDNSYVSSYLTQEIQYDFRGNIKSKTDAGNYVYSNTAKPNQLTKITDNPLTITANHDINYYINGKTKSVIQGQDKIEFTYGPDMMRVKTKLYSNSNLLQTKYFALGNYEEEVDETSGITTKYYYISGGNGLAAIYKQAGSASGTMYYVHQDHLGSIDLLTDDNGNVAERYSYDAWGNRRNPTNWQLPDIRTNLLISRGYTAQEHLDVFGLINLNGRMYEPLTARFLSPDNYVQAPGFSQSLNRYGYCFNNPLVYVDPDGELAWFIPVIIGTISCSYIGGAIAAGEGGLSGANWNPFGGKVGDWGKTDWWKGAIVGGLIGATAGYLWSAAVGPAGGITQNLTGFGKAAWHITGRGLLSASIDMATSDLSGGGWDDAWKSGITGFVSGALTRGVDYKRTWTKGFLKNALVQGSIGTLEDALGSWMSGEDITMENLTLSFTKHGITGGISGGLKSMYEGKNFWTGEYRRTGGICHGNIFRDRMRLNPKGAYSLSIGMGKKGLGTLNISLGGFKINVTPRYVTDGTNWPRYWKNAPILLPGMFWFTRD